MLYDLNDTFNWNYDVSFVGQSEVNDLISLMEGNPKHEEMAMASTKTIGVAFAKASCKALVCNLAKIPEDDLERVTTMLSCLRFGERKQSDSSDIFWYRLSLPKAGSNSIIVGNEFAVDVCFSSSDQKITAYFQISIDGEIKKFRLPFDYQFVRFLFNSYELKTKGIYAICCYSYLFMMEDGVEDRHKEVLDNLYDKLNKDIKVGNG